jgi:hypothetical protein
MKKICPVLIVFLLFSFGASYGQKNDSLSVGEIVRLAKEARKKQKLYVIDYTCMCVEELKILDKKGKIKHQETTKRKVYVKGEITHDEIVNAQKKGKSLSEKDIKKRQKEIDKEERKKSKKKDSKWISPFEEKGEGKFEFQMVGEDTVKGEATFVISVNPKEKAKELLKGSYWIDKQSYRILRSEFSPSKNPKFVKEMKIFVDFMEVEKGVFLPWIFKIKGRGGFLFFKSNFEIERTCQDYEINVGLKEEIFPQLQVE